jgi:hypothetical protein
VTYCTDSRASALHVAHLRAKRRGATHATTMPARTGRRGTRDGSRDRTGAPQTNKQTNKQTKQTNKQMCPMLPMESWPVTQGMPREGASLGPAPPQTLRLRPGVGISQYLHDSRGRGRCVEVLIAVSFVCLFVCLYRSTGPDGTRLRRDRGRRFFFELYTIVNHIDSPETPPSPPSPRAPPPRTTMTPL